MRKPKPQMRMRCASNFLVTTMTMIEENNHTKILYWSENGSSFVIENQELFFKMLPKYFKTKNYSSFVRQLNMYDFHKMKNEKGFHEFKHPLFKRGHPELLSQIQRKVNDQHKSDSDIKKDNHFTEPSAKESVMQSNAVQNLMKDYEERKAEYEKKITKLLFLLFTVGCDESKLKDIKPLFEELSSEVTEDGKAEQLKGFLFQASKLIFDKQKKTNIDTVLKQISPDGFRILFDSNSNAINGDHTIVVPQTHSVEGSVKGRESNQSFHFGFIENSNMMSPLRTNFNHPFPQIELSESGSILDRGNFSRDKKFESILPTPKNERFSF